MLFTCLVSYCQVMFITEHSVLMLRYKQPEGREWKVPLNFRIGKTEIPVGLGLITIALFLLATINVLTKKAATISGTSFTLVFFVIFVLSERYHRKKSPGHSAELEKFRMEVTDDLSAELTHVRPGCIIVAVRNPSHLDHLKKILEKTDPRKMDIV